MSDESCTNCSSPASNLADLATAMRDLPELALAEAGARKLYDIEAQIYVVAYISGHLRGLAAQVEGFCSEQCRQARQLRLRRGGGR